MKLGIRGFTLIELLIVIAILGVLGGGVVVAIDPIGKINSANLAKAKTFSASVENDLAISQVGRWSFDDQANPGKDISGYGNNGVLNGGATWQNASVCGLGFGGCLNFNGTIGQWVSVNGIGSLSFINASEITMEAWISPSETGDKRILGNNGAFTFRWVNQRFGGGPHVAGTWREYDSTSTSPLNTWSHVVVVYSETSRTVKIYVNGEKKQSVVLSGLGTYKITGGDNNISIGSWEGGSGYNFAGLIDEVKIYTQALSFAQIQQHYAQGLVKHQLAKM